MPSQQPVDHPHLDGVQVGEPLPQPRRTGPELPELQGPEFVGGLGAESIAPDQGLHRGEELLVLGHEDLRIEDPGFLDPRTLQHPIPQDPEVGDHVVHRLPQPAHLTLDLVGPDGAVAHLGKIPADDQRGSAGHPR